MIQTPQVFYFNQIFSSYEYLADPIKDNTLTSTIDSSHFFDDASVYELFNKSSPHLVMGEEYNIKITTAIDYFLSQKIHEYFKKLK